MKLKDFLLEAPTHVVYLKGKKKFTGTLEGVEAFIDGFDEQQKKKFVIKKIGE